jgi:hypothetical protein
MRVLCVRRFTDSAGVCGFRGIGWDACVVMQRDQDVDAGCSDAVVGA